MGQSTPKGSDPAGPDRWRGWPVILPILVGAVSVTMLAAQNAEGGIRLWDLVIPLPMAVLVGVAAWVASGLLTKRYAERGVLAAGLCALTLFGGQWSRMITDLGAPPWAELPLLVGVLAAFLASRQWWSQAASRRAARILAVAACVILLLNLAGMRSLLWESQGRETLGADELVASEQSDLPDIYFILLDAYSSPNALAEIYGLDITPFTEALEALGFQVAYSSRANYSITALSMSSMLSWDYLDALIEIDDLSTTDRSLVYSLLHDNATTRLLREHGYEVVFYRSPYSPLRSSPVADAHVPRVAVADFEVVWFAQTGLLPALRAVCGVLSCPEKGGVAFLPDSPVAHERQFASLASGSGGRGRPKFHYAHFLLPHDPFVFHADCSHRAEPYRPGVDPHVDELELRVMYAEQVECANRLVLETVDRILARDGPAPVIILQSDHGFGRLTADRPIRDEAWDSDRIRERMELFAAYYVPGMEGELTYEGITPVNAMRSVFSEVFDLSLSPLPDRSYWSNYTRPYDFSVIE
jgi:hypothetical protein